MRLSVAARVSRAGALALGAALALLLACIVGVLLGLRGLEQARRSVLASDDVIQAVTTLQRHVRMAETGQRGFLLTGQPLYLKPYRTGRAQIPQDFARFGVLDIDPTQAERLAALQRLVPQKLEELATTVDLAASAPQRALEVVRTDRGRRYMEEIDRTAGTMVEHERERLRRRTADGEKIARRTAFFAGSTALLAFLAAGAGLLTIMRQRRVHELEALNASLERRVDERTARLSLANQELDAFAYTISHDLRAPLRAMYGYAEIIEEDAGGALPPDARTFLGRIRRAADQMNRLIDDILAYAKLAKEDLSVRPVSLDGVADRAVETLAKDCADAMVEVEHPLGEALGHPVALQQVLDNLLSNACKYVRPGETPCVRIAAVAENGNRRVYVEDRGIGVPAEHYERIFQPFERLHGVEAYAGTGIGLAIVRRALERMGGRSGVEPRPGGGSRFWIELRDPEDAPDACPR